jgi:hypothetical protein
MNVPIRVSITVSEPWNFQDYNDGRVSFDGKTIATTEDHRWIVEFDDEIKYDQKSWKYAGLLERHVGQKYFDDPSETDHTANIMLIPDDIAVKNNWATSKLDIKYGPYLIGSVALREPAADGAPRISA